jgi:hypothetical protein
MSGSEEHFSDRAGIIPLARLGIFGDEICLRDPRGKSRRPSLVPRAGPSGPCLAIRGPFTVLQRFSISPAEGRDFVDTSRDANPIHTEDSVVSGAMTAARLLLLPEVLVPALASRSVRIKFRALSHYGRPNVNRFTFAPREDGGFTVEVTVFQLGVPVADCVLDLALEPILSPPETLPPGGSTVETIRTWYRSLRLDPEGAFKCLGYGYPRAFLASLPSGEMVRQGGANGLLNALTLEFPERGIPALTPERTPTVAVEEARPRKHFRRVLASVASGVVTYCTGCATVLLTGS